jgi:peptidoglycan/LPS O-acetylase OafA/YrhL
VLLFFVHTSYVLMLSLERHARGCRSLFWPFILRRLFRLWPLSLLTVAIVVACHLPVADVVPFREASLHVRDVVANLLLVQNLTGSESVIAPLWSLPYELQMYLVLPALFLFVRWRSSLWPVAVLWIVAVVVGRLYTHSHFEAVYDMPLYVPCFLAGVFAYQRQRSAPNAPQWSFAWWPFAILVVSFVYWAHPTVLMSWWASLAIGWLVPSFAPWPEGVWRSALRVIARYSYGIYLVHFACLWVAFGVWAPLPLAWQIVSYVGLTGLLSVVAYHAVEAPLIEVGRRVASGVGASAPIAEVWS